MKKQKAMKTEASKESAMTEFKEVELDENQLTNVKGGTGEEEEDTGNGIVETVIIDI